MNRKRHLRSITIEVAAEYATQRYPLRKRTMLVHNGVTSLPSGETQGELERERNNVQSQFGYGPGAKPGAEGEPRIPYKDVWRADDTKLLRTLAHYRYVYSTMGLDHEPNSIACDKCGDSSTWQPWGSDNSWGYICENCGSKDATTKPTHCHICDAPWPFTERFVR